jgi:hypothetical protein
MGKSREDFSKVTRVGLDLAKAVFQVHAVDAAGGVVARRKLRRGVVVEFFGRLAPCLVAMEACASAHHWGREIAALGHEVRLIPPAHVKPYVRRNKTDAADAAAICEAAMRPGQRFVPLRGIENQAELMRHRVRELLSGQRTALLNALRGHLSEIGIVAPQGAQHAYRLKRLLADGITYYGITVTRPYYGDTPVNSDLLGSTRRAPRASILAGGPRVFWRLSDCDSWRSLQTRRWRPGRFKLAHHSGQNCEHRCD